ncbi:MAG: DUF262 domain-containing protein [Ekhidna sp.]|nr:DUF262 domain-containing protein [Ekhidna sp.]
MEIKLKEVTVRELTEDYEDRGLDGVFGYGGKLDIRPPFQREFIYKEKQRNAVIKTIQKDFPLNVMYWAVRDNKDFEVIDGQQRTISICQYVKGNFSMDDLAFHNLPKDKKEQILDYRLMVYVCSGTDSEKLEWFKTINIAGEKLTDQELRNAVYAGPWVSDAKRYFSKPECAAYNIGSDYLTGSPIRQEYLETVIKWASEGKVEEYMSQRQHNQNASALWRYFQDVITWVTSTFVKKRKSMKGVDWGMLYNTFKDEQYDTEKIEKEVAKLTLDDDVKKSGIYPYILTRDEKYLSIRVFTDAVKQKVYERQEGICAKCNKPFKIEEMEADHITPWHEGGKTSIENCQMLCKEDNRRKSGK